MGKSNSICGAHEDGNPTIDAQQRKRIQNRAAQRTYREKLKRKIEDLEKWRDVALAMSSSQEEMHDNFKSTLGPPALASTPPHVTPLAAQSLPTPMSPTTDPLIVSRCASSSSTFSIDHPIDDLLAFNWNTDNPEDFGTLNDFQLKELNDVAAGPSPLAGPETPSPPGGAPTARAYEMDPKTSLPSQGSGSENTFFSGSVRESRNPSNASTQSSKTSTQSHAESEGKTALHIATELNQPKMVQMLMRLSSGLDRQDARGRTALHLAVEKSYTALVDILLDKSGDRARNKTVYVDVNVRDVDGLTPLHYAVRNGDEGVVLRLLQMPCINLEIKDCSGNTPLHLAVICGFEKVVEVLLANGADIDARVG